MDISGELSSTQEDRRADIPAPCFPAPGVLICDLHLVRHYSLGFTILGSDAKLQGGLRVALAAQREHPVVVTPAKAFSPNQSYGVILAVFLAAWPPLTPLYFPSSSSLTFLLLLSVPYLFSNNFPFCQVSHIGFYCLHPVILILVHCFWPWSSSPDLVNSLSTISRDVFQSYFCIILKISSSR